MVRIPKVTIHWYAQYTLIINGQPRRREMDGFISYNKEFIDELEFRSTQRIIRKDINNSIQCSELTLLTSPANTTELRVEDVMLNSLTRING